MKGFPMRELLVNSFFNVEENYTSNLEKRHFSVSLSIIAIAYIIFALILQLGR